MFHRVLNTYFKLVTESWIKNRRFSSFTINWSWGFRQTQASIAVDNVDTNKVGVSSLGDFIDKLYLSTDFYEV